MDTPRERPAPERWNWVGREGREEYVLTSQILLIVVKENCDGCREFLRDPPVELAQYDVKVVAHEGDFGESPVYLAPELLAELDIRWPPFYVLVENSPARVVDEGIVFSAAHVAQELTSRR
ncbi:MAG: hypothetical protein WCG86_07785 [Actinomycetota bacterium]